MNACIDLAVRFGDRYRLAWEARGATRSFWERADWPWLARLRCRHGEVYPYGGELLQAVTDRPRLGVKLRALPFILHARGDVETVVRFHVDDLPAVLAILKPYRRRQVAASEQERLRGLSARHGFGRQRISESTEVTPESPRASRHGVTLQSEPARVFPASEVPASPVRARGICVPWAPCETRYPGGCPRSGFDVGAIMPAAVDGGAGRLAAADHPAGDHPGRSGKARTAEDPRRMHSPVCAQKALNAKG